MAIRSEVDQTKAAIAALVACIVETLNETDPDFRQRIQVKMSRWFEHMRDRGEPHAMETISWVFDALSPEDANGSDASS